MHNRKAGRNNDKESATYQRQFAESLGARQNCQCEQNVGIEYNNGHAATVPSIPIYVVTARQLSASEHQKIDTVSFETNVNMSVSLQMPPKGVP